MNTPDFKLRMAILVAEETDAKLSLQEATITAMLARMAPLVANEAIAKLHADTLADQQVIQSWRATLAAALASKELDRIYNAIALT